MIDPRMSFGRYRRADVEDFPPAIVTDGGFRTAGARRESRPFLAEDGEPGFQLSGWKRNFSSTVPR